jgi:hypothetical protein
MPAAGFRRENCGWSALVEGLSPTWATFTISPTAMQIPAIGATVSSMIFSTSCSRPCSPAAEVTELPSAIWPQIAVIASPALVTIFGPKAMTPIRPPSSVAPPESSTERAT